MPRRQTISGMSPETYEKQLPLFYSFFSMVLSLATLGLAAWLLSFVKNELDVERILSTYVLPLEDFFAERPERCQYMVLTVLFPIVYMLFYALLRRVRIRPGVLFACEVLYPVGFAAAVYLFYHTSSLDTFFISKSAYYFDPMLAVLFSTLCLLLLALYPVMSRTARLVQNSMCMSACIVFALVVAGLYVTQCYYNNVNTLHHFDAYYYPVFEVYHGKTLLYDFNDLYGFYPYFIAPVLRLTGGISILRFSLVMAGLILVVNLSFFAVVWMNVKNKVIAMLGSLAAMFFGVMLPLWITEGYYLQYQPHRLLFPALITLTASLFLKEGAPRAKAVLQAAGFVLGGLSLLWNLETGIVTVAGWLLFLLYRRAFDTALTVRRFYIDAVRWVFFTVLSAAGAYLLLAAVTFARCGSWPFPADILISQGLFYGTGYYMLPMPSVHPWMMLVLFYGFALAKALRNLRFLRRGRPESPPALAALYFMLPVVGMGIFSYYQGRSHDYVFTAILWPAGILAALFAGEYYDELTAEPRKDRPAKPLNMRRWVNAVKAALAVVFLSAFALSLALQLHTGGHIHDVFSGQDYNDPDDMTGILRYMEDCIGEETKVDLIVQRYSYYYTKLGLKSYMPIYSSVDWFTKAQHDRVLDWLSCTPHLVILDNNLWHQLRNYDTQRFDSIINGRFERVSTYYNYLCYRPVAPAITAYAQVPQLIGRL